MTDPLAVQAMNELSRTAATSTPVPTAKATTSPVLSPRASADAADWDVRKAAAVAVLPAAVPRSSRTRRIAGRSSLLLGCAGAAAALGIVSGRL